MKRYIGLSLSNCVRDIAYGKVDETDVELIVAGTKITTRSDLQKCLGAYEKCYWGDLGSEGTTIAYRLWNAGKIYQPRVDGYESHNIANGHWVEIEVA